MRYRRLDRNQDYQFGRGQADFWINQPEAVGQSVFTRLMLWQGQWFYDLTEGTPWQTEVLGERTQSTRDVVVRERVLDTPEVIDVAQYTSVTDPRTRSFVAALTIDTSYGAAAVVSGRLPGTVPPLVPATAPAGRAQLLGILSGQTPVSMIPADLTQPGRTDITQFNVLGVDSGAYP